MSGGGAARRAAPGLLSRVWQSLRSLVSREELVGTDTLNNRYYRCVLRACVVVLRGGVECAEASLGTVRPCRQQAPGVSTTRYRTPPPRPACLPSRAAAAPRRWTEKDHAGVMVERRRVRVPGNDLLYDPKVGCLRGWRAVGRWLVGQQRGAVPARAAPRGQ
jgi:hypothetical protein